jgi:hypothetical protein
MGIFVRYENDGSTYRIIRLSDHKLVLTRHAIFSELEFPTLPGHSSSFPTDFLIEDEEDGDVFYDCVSDPIAPVMPSSPTVEIPQLSAETSLEFVTPPEVLSEESQSPAREIIGDISSSNIINHPRRPRAMLVSVNANIPTFYHQAI